MSVPAELFATIDGLTGSQLDALPCGAIQLDRDGTILQFNEYEANLSNRRAPDTVGRNFFHDVAPCTNVQSFAGRFREGVGKGDMHVIFPYRFDFEMAPRDVTVTLFYSKQSDTAWVFVREAATF